MSLKSKPDITWGIYPPRLTSGGVLYYNIILFQIQDDKPIYGEQIDLVHNTIIEIPKQNIEYIENLSEYIGYYKEFESNVLLTTSIRTQWLFKTREAALAVKLQMLCKAREMFSVLRQMNQTIFEKHIPEHTEQAFEDIQASNPELFL